MVSGVDAEKYLAGHIIGSIKRTTEGARITESPTVTHAHVVEIDLLADEEETSPTFTAGPGHDPAYAARLVDFAGVALIATDLEGLITAWNPAAEKLYGYRADELIGRPAALIAPAHQKLLVSTTIAALLRGERRQDVETTHLRADGARIDVALDFSVIRGDLGEPVGIAAVARDITDEKRVAEIVKRERDILRDLVTIQQELAAASDLPLEAVMQLVCERAQDLTGAEGAGVQVVESGEMTIRSGCGTLAFFVGSRMPVDGSLFDDCLRTDTIIYCRDTRKSSRVDRPTVDRMGARSLMLVPLHGREGIAGILKIVSSKPSGIDPSAADVLRIVAAFFADSLDRAARADVERALRARLADLAVTDGLTGLKNHRHFQERLAEEVLRSHRNGTRLSIIMLDVDKFKEYNDAYGHPAGDLVLKTVAEILSSNARATDIAARYGGEEFVFVLPHTELAGASALADRVRAQIAAANWPLRSITASLGVAEITSEDTPASLLARADVALYHAKSAGRNAVASE